MRQRITDSVETTQMFAQQCLSHFKPGETILVRGSLGAGKTTFIQALVRFLGVEKRIISPTYTLFREYQATKASFSFVVHADLYRLPEPVDPVEVGLQEYLDDPEILTLIEWPERLARPFIQSHWLIAFDILSQTKRQITLKRISR